MNSPFVILIDGACPICSREGAFLKRLDRGRGNLRIIDFTAPSFPAAACEKTIEELRGSIHGVTSQGEFITGMEVFRRAYASVGAGWGALWAPTGWPILRPIFDLLYRAFARNRVRISAWLEPCLNGQCAVVQRNCHGPR